MGLHVPARRPQQAEWLGKTILVSRGRLHAWPPWRENKPEASNTCQAAASMASSAASISTTSPACAAGYSVKYLAYFPDFLTRDSLCRHRASGMRVGGNLRRAMPFMPSVTTLIGLLHD